MAKINNEIQIALKYHQSGQFQKAESIYSKVLQANPNHSHALNLLGGLLHQMGDSAKAVKLIKKAIMNNPQNPDFQYNLGIVLHVLGKLEDANMAYRQTLRLKPDHTQAWSNLGIVLREQGQLDDAIGKFKKALQLMPDSAEILNNLGNVLKEQGQDKSIEAISCFQKALEIKPDYAEAYSNMGAVFKDQNELTKATSCFQKALEIKPDLAETYHNLFHQLQLICAWQKLEDMTAKLDEFTTNALENGTKTAESPLVSLARNADLTRTLAIAKSWSYGIAAIMSSAKNNYKFDDRRSCKSKITVGYLSNDFRNHAMAHLTLSLYGLHNRDEFKIFCYSYGEDDRSYHRKRIQQDCDKFVDIRNLSYIDAAKRIYEDRVDILVDFKGHTRGNRLEISALRPAPVQVRFLGLPCTTGADFFDYIATDRIVAPEDHAQYYSEKFAYLPHCYQINDHTQAISNKEWNKSDFGLPEDSFVFCSFNQGYKIEPVMFNTWMGILRQVPESVLWLQQDNEITENNLRHEAESRGIKPTRLIFSKKLTKDLHLGRLRLADAALDTRIVNGAITTSDALWAGVPVITLQGSNFASHMSSSILTAIGLPELITQTLEKYEFLAVGLARNPDKLQMIKQKIAKNRLVEPLFDTPRFTKNLERAYKEMWGIFIAGKRPRQIKVVEC